MKIFWRALAAFLYATLLGACTITHMIEEDYPQYLATTSGSSNLPKTDKASTYYLTPHTQDSKYEFRAVMSGPGNVWVVEFGKMLDDTLKSADVQAAFGSLQKVSTPSSSGRLLIFDLEQYTFEDFGAHISLKISLSVSGKTVFEKVYKQDGKSQGGKVFWGGGFAQRNAVQQSTKLALDEIIRRLIDDLNSQT
jgi:hypothetical protein